MSSIKEFQHLRIPLDDIEVATNNFGNNNYIGQGGFGKVYSGHLILSGKYTSVAIKRLDTRFGQGAPEFWKEIMMLSRLKHENLVSLIGFCDERGESILVYEYLPNKSLDLYLGSSNLSWKQRLHICIGAARGLKYLHDPGQTQQRVLHRDIKSANILLDQDWNAKISDFGLSKFGPANQEFTFLVSNAVGTMGYCDPLYHETGYLTKESDVYSFGVVLFEVLCGRLCVQADYEDHRRVLGNLVQKCREEKTLNTIIHGSLKKQISVDCLEMFTSIAFRCLHKDQAKRPSMAAVVNELEVADQYTIVENMPSSFIEEFQHLRIPLERIKVATNNFGDESFIGRVGLGILVYSGPLLVSGKHTLVAIKHLRPSYWEEDWKEIMMLSRYKHENLVSLIGFCDRRDEKFLVYEYPPNKSLNLYLSSSNLSWKQRLHICTGAARGLQYLHDPSETKQRVLHRDIKSANILLDQDWNAKISDLGVSKVDPAAKYHMSTFRVPNDVGTMGYLDPHYLDTGYLTKESDVYSFGVVLFEVICGIPAIQDYKGYPEWLTKLAKKCYKERKLDEIIHSSLKEQISEECLKIFTAIAYQCLHRDREERPSMAKVVNELEIAYQYEVDREERLMVEVKEKLESQVFDSYEHWKSKRGNNYVMKMLTPLGVSETDKKLILYLLHKGILFDNEKRFFSIEDDGMESVLMSPKMFLYPLSKKYEWEKRSNFRFSEVARFPYKDQLKIRCRISARMLCSGIMYAASLVFSFQREPQITNHKSSHWLTIKWKCEELNVSSTHCAQQTDDGWMKIRLWHFVSSHEKANFDIVLHKISYFHDQALPDIFIHGIEFHPVDMVEGIEKPEGVPTSKEDVNSKKKMPSDDCDGMLIDNGRKWSFRCKSTGGRCCMLPAIEILLRDSSSEDLDVLSLSESRFKEVVQLGAATTYAFTCEIESKMLSPGYMYACYLVFKFAEAYIWHDDRHFAVARYDLDNTNIGTLFAHLNSREPINIPTLMPKNNNGAREMSIVPISYDQDGTTRKEYMDDSTHHWMEQRNDGWMEVILCKSLHKLEDHKLMSVILTSEESDLYGIIVQGVEFRPM